ncbi:MAG: FkbM family methyltransferase [Candidatus Aenigmatarchaeota archaeon]
MFLDQKDNLGLSVCGIYEELQTNFLKKEIKKGFVVLDIGAHIGYYTLIFAKFVGKSGKVYAFEPDPTNFSLLKKNIEINGYDNVVLIKKAVSNKNGKIKLFLSEKNTVDHRIYESGDDRKFIEIESIKLDDFFENYKGEVNFIKMDIQGAEWMAISGMLKLLEKNPKIKIISEFWPFGLKNSGIEPFDYLKFFINSGFKIYEINEQKNKIELTNPEKLLKLYTPEKENYNNLIFTRSDL